MRFTDIFIKRPVLATVISLLILLLGLRSFGLLQVREYPQSESAEIIVSTAYTGANPQLVQGFITQPLEQSIAEADGIDYMESTSIQGTSQITVHLSLNYDPYKALTQITQKVNQVRNQLPAQAEVPSIEMQVGDTTDSMYMSFYSTVLEPNQITDYLTRVVQPKLQAVSGVQKAEILGSRKFAMRIWLQPSRMAALGVAPVDVNRVLAQNNYLSAVGKTKGNMISLDLDADTSLHSAKAFKQLVVKHGDDGAIVRLGDIAKVDLGAESYASNVRFNGKNATFVGIKVLPTANPLTVIKNLRATLPDLRQQLPQGLNLNIPYDATEYISDSINEVVKTLGEALLIVIVIIFLFLGSLRSVFIPVVTIPLALIGGGFLMLAMGFSINLLTLLAMVLAIGLVVDDAIIVVENIHRHIEEGLTPTEAALQGARELGSSVIAMTITLAAVYAPIGFIGGLTGALFTQFAFSLAGAVVISGIVALTLSPMLCSKMLKPHAGKKGFVHFLDSIFERVQRVYEAMLHFVLNLWPVVIVVALCVLVSCYFLFASAKKELAPTEDQGIILAQSTGAADASIDQQTQFTDEITKIMLNVKATANVFMLNGVGGGGSAATANQSITGMVLKPWSKRTQTQMQIQPQIQAALSNKIAGLQVVAFPRPPLPGSGGGLPIQFVVGSTAPPLQVYQVSQQLLQKAMQSGLFAFLQNDLKYDKPEERIKVDRDKVAALGLSMQQVGQNLGAMLGGNYVNYFSIQGYSYKVIPQVRRKFRLNPQQLNNYYIRTASGNMVPMSTFVTLEKTVQPEQLKQFQQLNSATLQGVPAPGVSAGQALNYLQSQARQIFPKDFSMNYGGQSRQFVQEGNALIVTFFFAIIIIFLVLAAQFESFRDPVIILVSVPMSISGALIFLATGFATVNIYTEVGLITLIGLISKHGILIVQFANNLQQAGYRKREAVEHAAGIRLRPILMTTAAMVLGVMPLVTATGAGALSRFDIGLVIATGMSIGTLFTLFVVPTVYLLVAKDHHGGDHENDRRREDEQTPSPQPA